MMMLPEAKDIRSLDIDESAETFLCIFLAIVRKYPQNRILLFAWIFCAYELARPFIATRCRAGFHTRRLGLMSSHNAAERLWWPLEGLGTATISHPVPLLLHCRTSTKLRF